MVGGLQGQTVEYGCSSGQTLDIFQKTGDQISWIAWIYFGCALGGVKLHFVLLEDVECLCQIVDVV